MHDQPLVRELDRVAHQQEQREPCPDRSGECRGGRTREESARVIVRADQRPDLAAELGLATVDLGQELASSLGIRDRKVVAITGRAP